MTIVTTYKAFAAAYPFGSRVPIVGPVKRTPKVCLPTKTVTVCAPASPAVPLVRQNAVRDDELTSQHALLDCVYSTKRSQEEENAKAGVFSSKRSIEKEEDERAAQASLVSYVVLGKVSGTTAGRGNCKQDRDRIIIGGKLLVVKWEQHHRSYAPATKDPLEISYEECAYFGIKQKRRHVFMRRGELVGGERGGRYYLDTISV
jgi:hypothetical protein